MNQFTLDNLSNRLEVMRSSESPTGDIWVHFYNFLLRKKRFKFTWNDIIVGWWAMSIYSRTKCSIRRDGGECMRRSHSKQFRKSVNNVCCLYELWTMKGFSCLPLTMWLHETPREREERVSNTDGVLEKTEQDVRWWVVFSGFERQLQAVLTPTPLCITFSLLWFCSVLCIRF